MKALPAAFGIVMSLLAVMLPIRDSGLGAAAEDSPTQPPHPPDARLFDNLTSWDYQSNLAHLSCDDVCKKEPEFFEVFQMDSPAFIPPNGSSEMDTLSAKVTQILDAGGWKKCKSTDTESGLSFDTYSKDGRLLQVYHRYSTGVGDGLGITIALKKTKPTRPEPSNVPVSITPQWKTYRNVPLGFEISYPPDWRVVWVEAGYGAITTIGNCNEENCLRMRLAKNEFGGDGFYIVISPEKIYSGEPCLPGTTTGGTVRFTPSGEPYSSCTTYMGPKQEPSTEYAIGTYPTFEDRQQNSVFEICEKILTLRTTLGAYRYEFTPENSELLPNSFAMKDVYVKILSTVKVTPARAGAGADAGKR